MTGRVWPEVYKKLGISPIINAQSGVTALGGSIMRPEVLQAMTRASASGDNDKAFEIYSRYLPLIVFEGQPGVAVRKDLFRMRGLMSSSAVRKPAASITDVARDQLADTIRRVLGDVDITQPLKID